MSAMDCRDSLLGRLSAWWQVHVLLILLVGLCFAVRLYDLEGKSLWSDEGLTLRRAEQPFALVLQNVNLIPLDPDYQDGSEPEAVARTPDLHPPLYFALMHLWIRVVGKSEFALRFPSVAAATLTVPLLYVLARSLLNRETGLWAALLGSISPFFLWYAQEARMYTWLLVLSLTSVYLFLRLLEDKSRRRDYVAYTAVSLALLYTHYAGFFLLAFEIAIYALYRLRAGRWRALAILIALPVAALPLVPYLWRILHVQVFSFTFRPLPAILREAWGSFSLGPTPSTPHTWWRLLPFLVLVCIGGLMRRTPERARGWAVGLGYLVLPILTHYLLSYLKPNYMNPRHLMVAAPAWELLMAHGLTTLRRWFSPSLVLMLGMVLFLRGQASYDMLTSHRFWKDDIRGAVEYIEARAQPGDAIVLHHPVIRLTFDYYYDGTCPETTIPRYGNTSDTEQARATFAEWVERYERIWFMYGPPPTYFPHEFLPNWADAHLFKIRQQEFEAWWTYVGVAAYQKSPPTLESLPADARAVDERWGAVHLVGVQAQDATAGETGLLDLYWRRTQGEPSKEPLHLKLELQDETGTAWYQRTTEVLPFYPPAAWPSDRVVHTQLRLPLPEDIPPIAYSVDLELVGSDGSRAIGHMRVRRSSSPRSASRRMALFADGIELLTFNLESNTFRAGYPLVGSLTWRAYEAPEEDYQLQVRLVDQQKREVITNQTLPSASGFPTSDWLPGDLVAGHLLLPLPADLQSGIYNVEIGLVETESNRVLPLQRWYGKREYLTLGAIQIESWALIRELPKDIGHRLQDVEIAGKILLRGYDLRRDEHTLEITLYWQAQETTDENYHVFIHVGRSGQPPLAQSAGQPVDWTRPTTSWREGEVIVDQHTVSLVNVPPGRYDLLAGFFEPETGQRPKTVVDGDVVPDGYILLDKVDVE